MWYRTYSDSFKEQGMEGTTKDDANVTVNYVISFNNTDYGVYNCDIQGQLGQAYFDFSTYNSLTTSSINVAGQANTGHSWKVRFVIAGY